MGWEAAAALALGAAAGGFVNGLAGTGTALFALPFLLVALPPAGAVAVAATLAVGAGLQGLWEVRGALFGQPRRLMRFLLPGLAGVPIGLALLSVIDATGLRVTVAALLILYGGYFGLRRSLPRFERPTPVVDAAVGFAGGVLGGAASLSGVLPGIWCTLRPWPKAETRAVLQPYNVAILGLTLVALAARGVFAPPVATALLVVLPVGFVAARAGIAVFRRLSDDAFRRLLIVMCLVLGAGILVQGLV